MESDPDDGSGILPGDGSNHSDYLEYFERMIIEDKSGVYTPQLVEILGQDGEQAHFGVFVDCRILLEDEFVLGHLVLRHPETLLNIFSNALVTAQERLLERPSFQDGDKQLCLKKNVHVRINWLPGANRKPNVSSLRSVDAHTFVQISGTVTRTGVTKVLEAIRVFECTNQKCSGVVRVFASNYEVGHIVEKPSGPCPTCKKCSSYVELREECVCHDFQEVKIQEQVQKLGMGSIPRSITVLVLHDLVDTCKAGDDVVITGVPIHRWRPTFLEERCNLETVIEANTIQVINASTTGVILTDELELEFRTFWKQHMDEGTPFKGRNTILSSICPQLYGLYNVKLAVALALVGCPTFVDPNGTKVRGEPHLLLVGDPGTGKSQFLRYAAKLAPRSILTTGTGTTSAGLTCSAVKEGNEYMLEAGALVLADRGVCCIDEFGSIQKHDRATIHEAMEQQTLSVAKAGLVCCLKTRTTIIAATNPKGSFDFDADLSTNTGIASPLLSRFDMVLIMLDKSDPCWDRTVSEFILCSQAGIVEEDEEPQHEAKSWDVEKLQAYLAYVKNLDPYLTPEAGIVITAFYKNQRNLMCNEAGRTTLRLLESLVRVSKAHARLMARNSVRIVDAVVSVCLIQMSLEPSSSESVSQLDFPRNPDGDMTETVKTTLESLGLGSLVAEAVSDEQRGFQEECVDSDDNSDDDDTPEPEDTTKSAYTTSSSGKTRSKGLGGVGFDFPASSQQQRSKRGHQNQPSAFSQVMSDVEEEEFEFSD
uniref:DNA helicase n=1 Tax=Mucochytrium quahogii TaxID=96639 RepID=A0A7S2S6M1_9STRA|mmetsp:Transcript_45225/g.72530  ORF Transcript_45225/g.72530 Transcript_45225/m.72530 type:complete len:764 (-) Transcript_45225:3698-5989(-)